jgi:rSAM/selenodomain-associated transferase 1
MKGAVIVFAKAPVAGQAKTRLIPALGAAGAAALAERMLGHTLAAAAAARPEAIELCVTHDAAHPTFLRLQQAHRVAMHEQGDGDLGARMARAFARVLRSHERAVLIGTDAPALDATLLRQASAALDGHDAVFVPALDGGYALVGLRSPQPTLFADISWSTSQVMAATRERLRAAGLRWTELPAVSDIDVPEDLVHLPPGWVD